MIRYGFSTAKVTAAQPSASSPDSTVRSGSARSRSSAARPTGSSTSPAVYLNDSARPAAAPARANQRRPPSSSALTANSRASATPVSAPTSVTAWRE